MLILEDEKYFTFSNTNVPGNSGYYTDDKTSTSAEVRFKLNQKFPPKVLV